MENSTTILTKGSRDNLNNKRVISLTLKFENGGKLSMKMCNFRFLFKETLVTFKSDPFAF